MVYSTTCWHYLILEFSYTGFSWSLGFFFFFICTCWQVQVGDFCRLQSRICWEAIRKSKKLTVVLFFRSPDPLAICLLFVSLLVSVVFYPDFVTVRGCSFLLLLLGNIPIYGYFHSMLSVHLLMDCSIWSTPLTLTQAMYNSASTFIPSPTEPEGHPEVKS